MLTRLTFVAALLIGALGCGRTPPPDDTGDTNDTEDTQDTDTEDTEDTDTDTSNPVNCMAEPTSLPAWAGTITPTTLVTDTAYTNTGTGLDAVISAADALTSGDMATVDLDVAGVTVTSLGFLPGSATNPVNVWFASGDGAMRTYLDVADGVATAPGDIVNFKVTEVHKSFGNLEITKLTDFAVVSSGNPVYVKESSGQTLAVATDVRFVHHIWGELTSAPSSCGPSDCFDYTHTDGTNTVVSLFRIENANLTVPLVQGDCIEIYAPMNQFQGDPQFDIVEFDWHRWYGNSGG